MIVSLGEAAGSRFHRGEYSGARLAESNRAAQQRLKAGDRSKLSIMLKFMYFFGLQGIRIRPFPTSSGWKERGARKSANFSLTHNKLYGDSIRGVRAPASLKRGIEDDFIHQVFRIRGVRAPASLKRQGLGRRQVGTVCIRGVRAPASLKRHAGSVLGPADPQHPGRARPGLIEAT